MTKTLSSILFLFVIGAAGSACTATGTAHYSASATMPTMVYVAPDVQVIEDYDEPIFYSSSIYWRYDGGVWYQSHAYTGGWVRVATPPVAIVRIQQPAIYVHYHASAHGGAQANASAVHQEKREEKQERKEDKQEQKQERKEEKQERNDDKHDNGKGHRK